MVLSKYTHNLVPIKTSHPFYTADSRDHLTTAGAYAERKLHQ